MSSTFRLTGKHVLAIIVYFFMTIFAANTILITLAVRSFPGEQEKKSYLQGLAYNERIAEREAQRLLGWTAEISKASLSADVAEIELLFASSSSTPVTGLAITGTLVRPADDGEDHALVFEPSGPGRYRAIVEDVAPGAWRLDAVALSVSGDKFTLEKRMTLE